MVRQWPAAAAWETTTPLGRPVDPDSKGAGLKSGLQNLSTKMITQPSKGKPGVCNGFGHAQFLEQTDTEGKNAFSANFVQGARMLLKQAHRMAFAQQPECRAQTRNSPAHDGNDR